MTPDTQIVEVDAQEIVESAHAKNPFIIIVAVAIALVVTMASVEMSDVLPFEGQATPTYGPMPTNTVLRKKPTTKKTGKALRKSTREARHAAASSRSR